MLSGVGGRSMRKAAPTVSWSAAFAMAMPAARTDGMLSRIDGRQEDIALALLCTEPPMSTDLIQCITAAYWAIDASVPYLR